MAEVSRAQAGRSSLRDRKVVEHTAEIEPVDLERAEAAHAEAWQEISRSCRTIAS